MPKSVGADDLAVNLLSLISVSGQLRTFLCIVTVIYCSPSPRLTLRKSAPELKRTHKLLLFSQIWFQMELLNMEADSIKSL